MDFIKICLIILVAVITVSCIPVFERPIIATINIATSLIVLYTVVITISPIISDIKIIFNNNLSGDLSIVFKTLGISLITQFVSDVATDNGNKSLANRMILTGKLAIIVLILPVYLQVLEIIGRIIK